MELKMTDGQFFAMCLQHVLTNGVENFAEDTSRRREFVDKNTHLLAGTMLVACFAFLESTLGRSWIDRHGGRATRELMLLRMIRNAFVHTNGHLRDLATYRQEDEDDLREFVQELANGQITDDRGHAYPCYIDLSDDGVARLNDEAFVVLAAITKAISH